MKTHVNPHGKGEVVAPCQSNYQAYTLPEGVSGLEAAPLYQLVALWGWQLGRAFSRDEVAVAFGLELHRAGDVMSYIRRMRPDRVRSRQHYERLDKGVRQRYMQIMAKPQVDGRPVTPSPASQGQQHAKGPQTEAALQELRRWFLGRPNPE